MAILLENNEFDILEEDNASQLLLEDDTPTGSGPFTTPDPSEAQWAQLATYPNPDQGQWQFFVA